MVIYGMFSFILVSITADTLALYLYPDSIITTCISAEAGVGIWQERQLRRVICPYRRHDIRTAFIGLDHDAFLAKEAFIVYQI